MRFLIHIVPCGSGLARDGICSGATSLPGKPAKVRIPAIPAHHLAHIPPPRIPIAVIGMQARPIKLHQALTVRLHPFNQPGIGNWINSLVL
ncbi:hypothetical protein [Pseudomonas fluorescens]|uniref:hypothetical protein n=1 Tax=Pseudomonas fluorescens TaxID=294 RepID=UPI0018AFE6EA